MLSTATYAPHPGLTSTGLPIPPQIPTTQLPPPLPAPVTTQGTAAMPAPGYQPPVHAAPAPAASPFSLEAAPSSFIASILAHLLGAHQGGLVGQMVAAGGHSGGLDQIIHGFGPQGAVTGNPGLHVGQLAPGTYGGAHAALALRADHPVQAAQLWESRHPYAVHHGNVPNWVTHALLAAIHGAQPAAPVAPAPPQNVNQPI